jgi:hypothetical protein
VNLAAIRQGIADKLSEIADVRVLAALPDQPQWGVQPMVIVLPDDPYVTYTEGSGRVNQNEVRIRLVVLPMPSAGAVRVQQQIDDLLSCGTTEPRSIRSKLGEDVSAGGTACALSVLSASVRVFPIAGQDVTGAEINLKIMARC